VDAVTKVEYNLDIVTKSTKVVFTIE